ncbi:MAG: fibronectin type III domain-containing protein, partial [Elusimicrobia bacterium]|nr:fibronectin type III domain-containing protein [Elusimicrobiota bacterium]
MCALPAAGEITSNSTFTGSMAQDRHFAATTRLPDGRVLLTGGMGGPGVRATAEIYDPGSGLWSSAGTMSTPRFHHAQVLLQDGRVLVVGGDPAGNSSLASAEIYHPSSGTWTTVNSMASARRGLTAVLLDDGRVLAAGGDNGPSTTIWQTAEIYDPGTGLWTSAGSMSAGHRYGRALRLLDGRVLVVGGETGSGVGSPTGATDVYSPSSGTWTTAGSFPSPAYLQAVALLPDGRVLCAGGANGGSGISGAALFNPATLAWTATASLGLGRMNHQAVLLPSGHVLMMGGEPLATTASVEIFDSTAGAWSSLSPMLTARGRFSATLLASGAVLAAGGEGLTSAELYSVTVSTTPGLPAAPSGLTRLGLTTSSIEWAWTDNSNDETGFRVMSGTISLSGDLAANATAWNQTGLAINAPYGPTFVQAFNSSGTANSLPATRWTATAIPGSFAAAGHVSSATLSWTDNGNPPGTRYDVYRSTIYPPGVLVASPTATAWADTGLPGPTTYWYRVQARNGDGTYAAATVSLSIVAGAVDSAPVAATAFAGSALNTHSIRWSWSDNSNNEAGYRVMSGATNLSGDLPPNSTSWTQGGLSTNTLRGPYFVRAFSAAGAADSPAASRHTFAAPLSTMPIAAVGPTTIKLEFSDPHEYPGPGNPGSTSWETELSTGGPFVFIGSGTFLWAGATVSGLAPSTAYQLRTRLKNGDGIFTAYTGPVSAMTLPAGFPIAPSGFEASPDSTGTIRWRWRDNASDELGYRVLRGTINLSGDLPASTTPAWVIEWVETAPGPNLPVGLGTTVEAFNATGTARVADPDCNKPAPEGCHTGAAHPENIRFTALSSSSFRVDWDYAGNDPARTTYEAGFAIYPPGFDPPQWPLTVSSANYRVYEAAPAGAYRLFFNAFNGDGTAFGGSDYADYTFPGSSAPVAPSALTGSALDTGRIRWTWTDNASDEMGYRVMSGTIAVSGDLPAGATSWLQTGLSTNTQYGPYAVRAFNGGGAADSTAASRYTLAAIPLNLSGAILDSSMTVTWPTAGNPPGTIYDLQIAVEYNLFDEDFPTSSATWTTIQLSSAAPSLVYVATRSAQVSFRAGAINGDGVHSGYDPGPVYSASLFWLNTFASFQGTALGPNSIRWSWNDEFTGEAGYRVMQGTASLSGDLAPNTTFWIQTGLLPGVSYGPIRLRAFGSPGWEDSPPLTVTTSSGTAPVAPAGFGGIALDTDKILWTWTDNASDEAGYRVMAGTTSLSGDLPPDTTSWLQAGLLPNRLAGPLFVRAFNAGGTVDSSTASRHSLAQVPAGPTLLTVGVSSISVTWGANGNPAWPAAPPAEATVWELQRSTGGPFAAAFVGYSASTFTQSGLSSNSTYTWRMRAQNGDGIWTGFGGVLTVVTLTAPPAAPTGFDIWDATVNSVLWYWSDNSGNEDGFRVLLGTVSLSGDLPPGTTRWTQLGLSTNSTVGALKVRAFNAGGAADSNLRTGYARAVPPFGLAADAVHVTSVTLSWQPGSNPTWTTWILDKSTFAPIVGFPHILVSPGPTVFTSTGLTPGTSYYFEVYAINVNGIATTRSTLWVQTLETTPLAPSGFEGSAIDTGKIRWTWTDGSTNEAGFRVMAGTTDVSGYLPPNTTAWLQTGLEVNTGYGPYLVRAFNTGGTADSNSASRYTLAGAAAVAQPPTPFHFLAPASTRTEIGVSWSTAGNPPGTMYELQRSTNGLGGPYAALATSTSTSYRDASPEVTTCFVTAVAYQVRVLNGDGIAATGSPGNLQYVPAPASPSGFRGTAAGPDSILWVWYDNACNETNYQVRSGTTNISGNLGPGATTWLQTGLAPNTLYGSYDVMVEGPSANWASINASRRTLARTPAGLAAIAATSMTITLGWSANDNPAGTVYRLERFNGASFDQIASTTGLSFRDAGLTPSATYQYRVRAENGDQVATSYAGPAVASTLAEEMPLAPTSFSGVALGAAAIRWSWTPGSTNERGFRVMSGTISVSGDLPPGTTTWLQAGLGPNAFKGPYVARAFNLGGTADSGQASRATLAAPPSGLAVTAVSSTSVSLTWGAAGNPAGTTYQLLRSTGGGASVAFSGVVTSYADYGLTPSTLYAYQLQAVNVEGAFTAGPSTAVVTGALPAAAPPSGFAGTPLSSTRILWTWTDNSGSEAGYRVMLGAANVSGNLPPDTTAWLQLGLATNTWVGPYRVQSFNAGGVTESGPASAATFAATPADLLPSSVSPNSVSVAWTANGNPAGTRYASARATTPGGLAYDPGLASVATTAAFGG